jgi:hypothetical protein
MARNQRISRKWCGIHGMYYAAWADAKQTKQGTCFMCDDEKARAEAVHQRRAEQAAKPEGSA